MGNSGAAVQTIHRLMEGQERSIAWLARKTKTPYKRLLAEVKNQTRPLTLETAIAVADALGADLIEILRGMDADETEQDAEHEHRRAA